MRLYTKTGFFKSDTTYHFRCEYCGHEHSVNNTFEREIKDSRLGRPPTNQEFFDVAQKEFKQHQDIILSDAEKWKFAVSAKCPNCGFFPTYMVNRKQTISLIIGWLIIGVGIAIPFFIPGVIADIAMVITFSLLCFVPYLFLIGLLFHRLSPNRKLMRAISAEGRSLASPEKPRIVFSPTQPKLD